MSKRKHNRGGFAESTPSAKPKPWSSGAAGLQQDQRKQALVLIKQGRLEDGEKIFRKLLENGSTDHKVHGDFATLCGMQGRYAEMVLHLKQAVLLNPGYVDAYNNLGVGLKSLGDLNGAIDAYQKALELQPRQAKTYFNLANALKEQSNAASAAESYRKALEIEPSFPEAWNNLGNALKEQGELESAIRAYQEALSHKADYPNAINNLGNALKERGDLDAAIACHRRALQLKPKDPEIYFNLGVALKERGEPASAVQAYSKALQLKADYPEALTNLGNALRALGKLDEACQAYRKALAIKPDYPEAFNNLGLAFKESGKVDLAIIAYKKALEQRPGYHEAYNNLGVALKEQGRTSEALAAYNKALAIKPDYAEAHWNSGLTMLLRGEYEPGWEKYEWRRAQKVEIATTHAVPACAKWTGSPLDTEKQLLLVTEQGLGDTMLFMRYVKAIRDKGINVSLCAQSKLHALIRESGIDTHPIAPEEAEYVTQGHWMPLLSVPRHLKVSPENPIINEPYIKSTDELVMRWKERFSGEQRPLIGINWQGNPETEITGLRGRSLSLESLSPIQANNQLSLVSLQKGYGSEQLESCSFRHRFVSCQAHVSECWDFLETAAIIDNCDLVITSDTSVAHLAGGMGKATWLLLHNVPDWRWGLEGDTTFWYPSMRLYRQKTSGSWDEVLARVRADLKKWMKTSVDTASANNPIELVTEAS